MLSLKRVYELAREVKEESVWVVGGLISLRRRWATTRREGGRRTTYASVVIRRSAAPRFVQGNGLAQVEGTTIRISMDS